MGCGGGSGGDGNKTLASSLIALIQEGIEGQFSVLTSHRATTIKVSAKEGCASSVIFGTGPHPPGILCVWFWVSH